MVGFQILSKKNYLFTEKQILMAGARQEAAEQTEKLAGSDRQSLSNMNFHKLL
jgi:hypothetical protein